jgi:ABC-type nitrate/sulfonate/bicarbonate transport system permease component
MIGRLALAGLGRLARLLLVPALLIGLWWLASVRMQSFYLPTPGAVAVKFREVWIGHRLVADVLPSLGRLATGYLLAGLLGVGLGLPIGLSRSLRAVTEPALEFFRAIPPTALVPVLILFAGLTDTMKVLVIISGCVWPVLLNTVQGVRSTDPVQLDTARSFRIGGLARLRYLVLPSAGPHIMAGLRQALSIAIILMVISEMFASTNGLGFAIVQFQRTFAIPEMWSGILLLGLLGILLSAGFRWIERRVLRWYVGERRSTSEAGAA